MLKKEDIQRLATLTKIPVADLEKAITDKEEVALTIAEKLEAFTPEEVTTLKANEYKSGKEAGVEMAVKDTKEKLGLTFNGKSIESLVDAATKKALDDAKVTPDAKVKELETKLTTLQGTVKEYETKLADKETEVSGIRVNSELYKHIPSLGEKGPALTADEVINLMKANGYEFKQEDGAVITYKGGKALTDKLSNNLPVKDVVNEFIKEKKLVAEEGAPGGRGGSDKTPAGKAGKLSELKKEFTEKGKSLLGTEFSEAVSQAAKDNKDFVMD